MHDWQIKHNTLFETESIEEDLVEVLDAKDASHAKELDRLRTLIRQEEPEWQVENRRLQKEVEALRQENETLDKDLKKYESEMLFARKQAKDFYEQLAQRDAEILAYKHHYNTEGHTHRCDCANCHCKAMTLLDEMAVALAYCLGKEVFPQGVCKEDKETESYTVVKKALDKYENFKKSV